jgi:hypothetical protein
MGAGSEDLKSLTSWLYADSLSENLKIESEESEGRNRWTEPAGVYAEQ